MEFADVYVGSPEPPRRSKLLDGILFWSVILLILLVLSLTGCDR